MWGVSGKTHNQTYPQKSMSLTGAAIKAAKPGEKPYKLFDERGLYLLVHPNGGRRWRLKYRVAGREKLLAIGVYPDVSLVEARERRDEARRLLVNQVDPNARKKAERLAEANTFEVVAREWLELQRPGLTPKTFAKKLGWFEDFLFPYIGRHPIAQITSPDLLAALKRIEARGHRETAHRARSSAGNVLRYAIATGRAERDTSAELRGQPTTESALKLAPLLFIRPGELRAAEWVEFSLDAEHPHWRIPGSRMKMGEEHLVPLARQAIAILREIEPVAGGGRYVFPSLRGGHRPISETLLTSPCAAWATRVSRLPVTAFAPWHRPV